MEFFSSNLQYLRKQKGFSQADLAEQLGESSQTRISNYESGKRLPGFDTIEALQEIFKVSKEDLLFNDLVPSQKSGSPDKKNVFPSNLRFLRKQQGLSQGELADQLGGSKQNRVSNYENGKSFPGIDTIKQLTAIFDVSTDNLLSTDLTTTGKEQKPGKNSKRKSGKNQENLPELKKLQQDVRLLLKNDKINSPTINMLKNMVFELKLKMEEMQRELKDLKGQKSKPKKKSNS